MSRRNSEINELLKQAEDAVKLRVDIVNRIAKDKADTELKNNKEILEDIAKKQLELAKMAIEKWYNEEKGKI
jgi:thiamine monophosphate synthase